MSNSIKKRIYYALTVQLASPLCVSGNDNNATNKDVMRNRDGEAFVPGSSLAGAIRNVLEQKKDESGLMGYSKDDTGRMSSLFVSDLYFDQDLIISIRDRIALNSQKTVDNKFDMEIIETGAQGMIYLEIILREEDIRKGDSHKESEKNIQDTVRQYDEDIQGVIWRMEKGELRLGSNKNRGFGRLSINTVYRSEFGGQDCDQWLEFLDQYQSGRLKGNHADNWLKECYQKNFSKEWIQAIPSPEQQRYLTLSVPLRLMGGISIRRYSAQPQKADFEQITCNDSPVIPGNSWNGLLRSRAQSILIELGMEKENVNKFIEEWFGSEIGTEPAPESNNGQTGKIMQQKQTRQSQVIINESILKGSRCLPVTRNRIDRFDASTKDGALYSELAYFGGETSLDIMMRKDEQGGYQAFAALLEYIIQDIGDGMAAVGGQTAIGRGIFSKKSTISWSEPFDAEAARRKLYEQINPM